MCNSLGYFAHLLHKPVSLEILQKNQILMGVNLNLENFNNSITHLAGRSRRKSMPNTTASSPADRKEQGESGSRASWKKKKGRKNAHRSGYWSHKEIYHRCNLLHLNTYTHTCSTDTHLVCCPFMLCYPLGVLAALCGRELGHSDLTISSAHGQGGVPAVRQELCLCTLRARRTLI